MIWQRFSEECKPKWQQNPKVGIEFTHPRDDRKLTSINADIHSLIATAIRYVCSTAQYLFVLLQHIWFLFFWVAAEWTRNLSLSLPPGGGLYWNVPPSAGYFHNISEVVESVRRWGSVDGKTGVKPIDGCQGSCEKIWCGRRSSQSVTFDQIGAESSMWLY